MTWRTHKRGVLAIIVLLATPALAQPVAPGRPALQAVGLFEHACLPYAGLAGNLRAWATGKGLRFLPDSISKTMLFGQPGQVFNASTKDGRLGLISLDSGACAVIAPSGDKTEIEAALQGVFSTVQAIVTLISDKTSPDGLVTQRLELVTLKNRNWHVSVTERIPGGGPRPSNVLIMATAAP